MLHKTKNGYVTQNGCWISLKTNWYSEQLAFFQALADELADFLENEGIAHSGDFSVVKVEKSARRKGCVTVRVTSQDDAGMSKLFYEADAND